MKPTDVEEASRSAVDREWAKHGVLRGLVRTFHRPGDFVLAARIGWFLLGIERRLASAPLHETLRSLSTARRPAAADPESGTRRISRLRQAWLMMPALRSRNTCYVRAITLYRFLNAGTRDLKIHFGVEPGVNENDRLHGHAWVTVNGALLEAPEPVLAGRVREIYAFPSPVDDDG